MKFKIIANEQTPELPEMADPILWISYNQKLLEKFVSFSRRQINCAGLASNQVSVNGERIMARFFTYKGAHGWDVYINPKILKYSGKAEIKVERCLTWIGKVFHVKRHPEIELRYFNIKGEICRDKFQYFPAQVIQHEVDHLNGVTENIE